MDEDIKKESRAFSLYMMAAPGIEARERALADLDEKAKKAVRAALKVGYICGAQRIMQPFMSELQPLINEAEATVAADKAIAKAMGKS